MLIAIKIIRDPNTKEWAETDHNDGQQNKTSQDQVNLIVDFFVKEDSNGCRDGLEQDVQQQCTAREGVLRILERTVPQDVEDNDDADGDA